MTQLEIEAFKSGECDKFIDLFDDNITFYADGRKAPNKEMILGFCKRVPRPFEKPSSIEMEYFPLTKNSAFVVRTMEFAKDEKVYKKEFVTKIWVKGSNGWKITHLHSTIKKLQFIISVVKKLVINYLFTATEMADQIMYRLQQNNVPYPNQHLKLEGGHTAPLKHFNIIYDFLDKNLMGN